MATGSTSGVTGGSQIDVNSLSQQLVAAERKPLDNQIQRAAARVTTQVSAVGFLMGALSGFRSALTSLKTVDAFAARSATSSDTAIFQANASAAAAPGVYSIEVTQLAKAQQLSSNLFVGGGVQVIGTGALTLKLGSKSISIDISTANSSLAGIRDAINAAPGNPGISATLVNEAGGAHLLLTSSVTGAGNVIEVSHSGGDGGLAQLAYSPANTANYSQLRAAQDAIVEVAGYSISSSSNVVTNAIDGVTLTLNTADPGATKTLTVGYDLNSITAKVNAFVSAYNSLRTQLKKLGGYDSATKTAGPMLGDSLLSSIEDQLRRTLQTPVSGVPKQYATLANIGVTSQADGSLAVDSARLQAAIGADIDAVSKLFGSSEGVAAKLYGQVDERLKPSSALDNRSGNLAQQQRVLATRQAAIDARMESLLANYKRQFTALDKMLSSMQTTSSFLSQQIDALSNFIKPSK